MTDLVYLDNNATTPPLPEVVTAMREALEGAFGNPSSLHGPGIRARALVDAARDEMATLIGAPKSEVIFTSGATESINTAIFGAIAASKITPARFVTTAVEHEAVIEISELLAARGVEIERVGVDAEGRLDLDAWRKALARPTTIASLMLANNETGVILDVPAASAIAHEAGALVHVDAVQAVGKLAFSVEALGADLLSLSAHKFHGPKGTGILYWKRGARIKPLVNGASQEAGRRAGTENVAGIVGMAAAARHMRQGLAARRQHLTAMGARIEAGLAKIAGTRINGAGAARVPGTVNVSFEGIEGSAVVLTAAREGVCLSAGSACSAAQFGGSHVLEAMGVPYPYLHGAVRWSCSEHTTEADIDRALEVVARAVGYLRAMRPGAAEA